MSNNNKPKVIICGNTELAVLLREHLLLLPSETEIVVLSAQEAQTLELPEKIEMPLIPFIPYKPIIPLPYKDERGYSHRPIKKKKFKNKNKKR